MIKADLSSSDSPNASRRFARPAFYVGKGSMVSRAPVLALAAAISVAACAPPSDQEQGLLPETSSQTPLRSETSGQNADKRTAEARIQAHELTFGPDGVPTSPISVMSDEEKEKARARIRQRVPPAGGIEGAIRDGDVVALVKDPQVDQGDIRRIIDLHGIEVSREKSDSIKPIISSILLGWKHEENMRRHRAHMDAATGRRTKYFTDSQVGCGAIFGSGLTSYTAYVCSNRIWDFAFIQEGSIGDEEVKNILYYRGSTYAFPT